MPIFLDTTGLSTLGIGICARCSRKMSLLDLYSDPNSPGLMVCKDDLDELDPYRLPARQTERINLDFVRPDLPLTGVGTPYVLPGYIITENGFFVISEDDIFIAPEGASDLETESSMSISTDSEDLIVEPVDP